MAWCNKPEANAVICGGNTVIFGANTDVFWVLFKKKIQLFWGGNYSGIGAKFSFN